MPGFESNLKATASLSSAERPTDGNRNINLHSADQSKSLTPDDDLERNSTDWGDLDMIQRRVRMAGHESDDFPEDSPFDGAAASSPYRSTEGNEEEAMHNRSIAASKMASNPDHASNPHEVDASLQSTSLLPTDSETNPDENEDTCDFPRSKSGIESQAAGRTPDGNKYTRPRSNPCIVMRPSSGSGPPMEPHFAWPFVPRPLLDFAKRFPQWMLVRNMCGGRLVGRRGNGLVVDAKVSKIAYHFHNSVEPGLGDERHLYLLQEPLAEQLHAPMPVRKI